MLFESVLSLSKECRARGSGFFDRILCEIVGNTTSFPVEGSYNLKSLREFPTHGADHYLTRKVNVLI